MFFFPSTFDIFGFDLSLFEAILSILFLGILLSLLLFSVFFHTRRRRFSSLHLHFKLLKSLLESLSSPSWMCDTTGTLIWCNESYLTSLGVANFSDACHHESHLLDSSTLSKIRSFHSSASRIDGYSIYNSRLPVTMGENRCLVDLYDISFPDGSAGLAFDISEASAIRDRLSHILHSHAQTLNALSTAIVSFDDSRQLIFHNSAFRDLWDLSESDLPESLDNVSLLDLLRSRDKLNEPSNWQQWRDELLSVYHASAPYEHWWHLPDGRTLRVVGSPQEHGGVTWVFEDISEGVELERRYASLSRVQGETLDNLQDGVAVFGSDGRLKLSNPSFSSLWSLGDFGNLVDVPISDISVHCSRLTSQSDIWDTFVLRITSVADERESLRGRLTTHSGERLDYVLLPLPDGQSMLSFSDVTAEQLKSDFLEHISTEFRRPLTTIIGFSELLSTDTSTSKRDEYIGHIISSSHILRTMVNNMLDLATVAADAMQLSLDTIDLQDTIDKTLTGLSEELKAQDVRIDCSSTFSHIDFVADSLRIQQILYNLLTNAIRFSPKGGVIRLDCESEQDGDIRWVNLIVSDEGPGIPISDRSKIFNRFESKAHSGTARGFGLGLSITRSLVELHGGTIELDTTTDRGACFKCRFPQDPNPKTST